MNKKRTVLCTCWDFKSFNIWELKYLKEKYAMLYTHGIQHSILFCIQHSIHTLKLLNNCMACNLQGDPCNPEPIFPTALTGKTRSVWGALGWSVWGGLGRLATCYYRASHACSLYTSAHSFCLMLQKSKWYLVFFVILNREKWPEV